MLDNVEGTKGRRIINGISAVKTVWVNCVRNLSCSRRIKINHDLSLQYFIIIILTKSKLHKTRRQICTGVLRIEYYRLSEV